VVDHQLLHQGGGRSGLRVVAPGLDLLGSQRARCCDGWVALRGAAAGLDRRLAKAEFRPYMRADLIVNITMHVFAKSEFESDKSTPWSLPC